MYFCILFEYCYNAIHLGYDVVVKFTQVNWSGPRDRYKNLLPISEITLRHSSSMLTSLLLPNSIGRALFTDIECKCANVDKKRESVTRITPGSRLQNHPLWFSLSCCINATFCSNSSNTQWLITNRTIFSTCHHPWTVVDGVHLK